MGTPETPTSEQAPADHRVFTTMLNDVLALENDRRLLDFRFGAGGLLLWPFVRFDVLSRAITRRVPLVAPASLSPQVPRRDLRYWRETIGHGVLALRRTFDVVFVTSSGSLVPDDSGARYVDRIHDAFVGLHAEQTLVVESSLNNRFRRPRSARFVRTLDGVERLAGLLARVRISQ